MCDFAPYIEQLSENSAFSQKKIENMWRWKYLDFWASWGVRWDFNAA